jgi:aminoglycoside phosphotransferase (APT) family kinase protein
VDLEDLEPLGVGWDNVVWATRDGLAFRFPRRQVAVPGLEREIAVLPHLAGRLPLATPDASHLGAPSPRFRWPWMGSRIIPGRELAEATLDAGGEAKLARALAAFLGALHQLELDLVLPLDPMGRADMAIRVPRARDALAAAARLWQAPAGVEDILDEAARLPSPSVHCLVHGDLHLRHVLMTDGGTPVGVIDWGDVCHAHPSVDLSLYWSALSPPAREQFSIAYGDIGESGLLRARVLSLFLCATLARYAHAEGMMNLQRAALRGLELTLIE